MNEKIMHAQLSACMIFERLTVYNWPIHKTNDLKDLQTSGHSQFVHSAFDSRMADWY